ncbi:Gfo/Idh/MocA family protein [Streptomyces sp. NEAU-Y11]|uniref:Gfo/Idh/MocA family protein n=1 Tax=Streptomyces cucumeris TaxID=2962890 RepID=UPI0020C915D0|nr:Gfo/Idh/MocA family oxidoreductase [Streptomyces sp. NEAU-Y11]MCP9211494.1 Gfo/Idh/MocA family oxidoreductase [Streptomyces sp. NEAU-Y11]
MIGIGGRTLKDYVPALVGLFPQIEIIAACDVDAAAEDRLAYELKKLGSTSRPRFFRDHKALLDEVQPDIAIVVTPHHTHVDVSKDLFQRGIPFIKEKPFALSLPQAYELADAVEKHDGHMRICVQRRYNPLYVRAKAALQEIGEVRHFDAVYQLSTDAYQAGWRAQSATSGGGAIIDMGYHIIDLLHWFFGMPSLVYASAAPKLIPSAAYDIEETVLSNLSYENGVTGTLRLSLCEASKEELIRIHGADGHIRLTKNSFERFDRSNTLVERVDGDRAVDSTSVLLVDVLDNLSNREVTRREVIDGVQITTTIESLYQSISQKSSVKTLNERTSDLCVEAGDRRRAAHSGSGNSVPLAEAATGVV